MRAITAVFLLLIVAGCGKSRAELIESYEAELRELSRIEQQMQEIENERIKSLDALGPNVSEESKKTFDSIRDMDVKQLQPQLEAQKLRVEEARKLKDAAK